MITVPDTDLNLLDMLMEFDAIKLAGLESKTTQHHNEERLYARAQVEVAAHARARGYDPSLKSAENVSRAVLLARRWAIEGITMPDRVI